MKKSFVEFVKAAEVDGLKATKLAALSNLSDDALHLLHETLNPYRQFNIKKFVEPKAYADEDGDIACFTALLDKLAAREITGNEARKQVTQTFAKFTEETASYLTRVLMKKLDCGISATTVNKVYPGLIPDYGCMLAGKCEDMTELPFPCIASIKLDGLRLNAIQDGFPDYRSRSGKPSDHCNGLFDDDLEALEKAYGFPIVVDGESMGDTFQQSMKAKGSKNISAKAALKFYAFDLIPLENWVAQSYDKPQLDRYNELVQKIKEAGCTKIIPVEQKVVNNIEELQEYYKDVVARGYEGLIIKTVDGLYEWDRSKNWLKVKPFFDVDAVIVDMEEGTGRLVGSMGAILVEGEDENGRRFKSRVGSGFSDNDRVWFWNNRDTIIAKRTMVQIKVQEISKAENSDAYSLRFPTYEMIRTDKED